MNEKATKDELFFTLTNAKNDTIIIGLKRKKDLLQLMYILRENLVYGILFKIDDIKIGLTFLEWLKVEIETQKGCRLVHIFCFMCPSTLPYKGTIEFY